MSVSGDAALLVVGGTNLATGLIFRTDAADKQFQTPVKVNSYHFY